MKRSGFQFKQFFIEHTGCAMKVGTDSIMLGSWIEVEDAQHILDIGTGSGLLAIMLAQKATINCQIVGVDIDRQAIQQAQVNGKKCRWQQQLTFAQSRLQDYKPEIKYDLIVSNPPYFAINQAANPQFNKGNTNTLSNAQRRVTARQTTELSYQELLEFCQANLSPKGLFCCVLPADIGIAFIELAAGLGLYCQSLLEVKSKTGGKSIRYLLQFSKLESIVEKQSLIIHNTAGGYSDAYRSLCKEYYLNF